MTAARIGIFDSGVGGLSVLRALHARLPGAALHYVADSAHAPYGERDDAHILARSTRLAEHLIASGAQVIVVACNTATAVAVNPLREAFGALPVVGVEPGLKPARAATRNGRIGVMATAATLRSARFRALLDAHVDGAFVHLQACDGLAAAIEAGELDAAPLRALVEQHTKPLRAADVDTVVLGCTHYPFVRPLIEAAIGPGVQIVDTAEAIARRCADVCAGLADVEPLRDRAAIFLETTGVADHLRSLAACWLPFDVDVAAAPAALR